MCLLRPWDWHAFLPRQVSFPALSLIPGCSCCLSLLESLFSLNFMFIIYTPISKKAKWKDRSSLFLTVTPKSQLTAEQLTTKKPYNLERKILYFQRQRSHKELVGEAQSLLSQIPYPPGGQPTNWKTIIPQKFSRRSENSKPQSGFPAWASNNWSKSP